MAWCEEHECPEMACGCDDDCICDDDDCICEWPNRCGGMGIVYCAGCGGDQCVCTCGGEMECFGCDECPDDSDNAAEWDADAGSMKEKAFRISKDDLHRAQFSHARALEITGLSADTLLTWHKRGMTLESHAPGRGNRRKYSVVSLVHLLVTKTLSETGVELMQAGIISAAILPIVHNLVQEMEFYETVEELTACPMGAPMIAVFSDPTKKSVLYSTEHHSEALVYSLELFGATKDNPLPSDIGLWMRKRGLKNIRLVDLAQVVFDVMNRIAEDEWRAVE